jgi:hypothetical protein
LLIWYLSGFRTFLTKIYGNGEQGATRPQSPFFCQEAIWMGTFVVKFELETEHLGVCRRCSRPFHVGDKIIAKKGTHHKKTCHIECWHARGPICIFPWKRNE